MRRIVSGKYKNVDELIKDLKATLPSSITGKDAVEANSQLSNYHFYQDISKLVVYYVAAVKTVEYPVTLRSEDIITSGLSTVNSEASTTTYYIDGKKFDAFSKEMEKLI